MNKIPLAIPHMSGHEMSYIQQAFDTNWIAPVGPNINLFEEKVRDYTGASYSVATSSGTAALHLALDLIGVEKEDTVFCSTFTFIASANPIIYQSATPIFIDSELETWNMSPIALEKALLQAKQQHQLPKAIIVVHIYGQPAKMNEILALAQSYGIPVIEDAAESLGSKYYGKDTGTLGELGIYSFNGNKIITTSGGGMLVSRTETTISSAKFLAEQAKEQAPYYQHEKTGYNYRLSNISAGIGCGQMAVLDKRVAQKRDIYVRYYEAFFNKLPVTFQTEIEETFSNRWLTALQFKGITPLVLKNELDKYGIEARLLWKPLHMQPVFKDAVFISENNDDQMSNAEYLFSTGLCLPSATQMTEAEQNYVIEICMMLFKQLTDNK
ncbi:DegT/DnrJ/EryC1/StrS family aminotransferase [Brochothrix thermosphacta]|uniref:DegT/DnrJ/EryC1/StrS family aminotransferase n=1 Tax=Brochothrix thermosphacta TaxID=2756 RepID=UPI00083FAAF8|nr:DegT/DnrJ/EryC1/StrS family aminotransferase [Brochothrix thermosphacta]SLN04682.1 Lipopolysaccharide biosynthesis protein RffA [Brachybacterium faecium]ODJ53950.1 pyridoxal phosphate-dependent aminotransferase [Brochothrix thermosphacta]ODJ59035.1 pyridoxal phosphate-dependent aminotransferase [Brochothrix thermosphacta]ODJ62575.1 pyridoxal phosphate-dependent aminotransferase [Brochothrix thermosphacta]ODJ66568.1 pyridoxal phosphate-dependent aminotransferase [Brochothrix thermosphacta]